MFWQADVLGKEIIQCGASWYCTCIRECLITRIDCKSRCFFKVLHLFSPTVLSSIDINMYMCSCTMSCWMSRGKESGHWGICYMKSEPMRNQGRQGRQSHFFFWIHEFHYLTISSLQRSKVRFSILNAPLGLQVYRYLIPK